MNLSSYRLYKSQYVVDNQNQLLIEINNAVAVFNREFNGRDSTWDYRFYNTFCLTAPSVVCYNLFTELKKIVREYVGHDRPLWIQSWINYHFPDQVLKWHNHSWPYHGYISIDPKMTKTVFEGYEITNEVGNIYIGEGNRKHCVEVLETFTTPRITIGFDVTDVPNIPGGIFSLIPI